MTGRLPARPSTPTAAPRDLSRGAEVMAFAWRFRGPFVHVLEVPLAPPQAAPPTLITDVVGMADDTSLPLYFGLDGRPVSADEWQRLIAEDETRILRHDTVLQSSAAASLTGESPFGPVRVVTRWLGTDRRRGFGEGLPLIFGSCLWLDAGLHAEGRAASVEVEWYATRAEALAGHAAWVAALRDATPGALARLVTLLRAREAAVYAALRGAADDADGWAAVDRSDAVFFATEAVFEALDSLRASRPGGAAE